MTSSDSYISIPGLDNMDESFAWNLAPSSSPLPEYSFEYFSADSSSGLSTLTAHDHVASKEDPCTIGNFWEIPRSSLPGYATGFLNGLPLIETVGPGSIKDEPLSAISDGSSSSINSPAITDCSSPERIHGQSTWNPVSVGPQRKRCLSDCVSSPAINQTRGRSASDAYSTFQTFPGTLYDGFQGPSSYSPIPPPAGHCYQPYPTWSRSHSNPDFPTDLPVQQSAEYDYSSMGLYDGDRQGCLSSGDVIGNGQMPITSSQFKAQVASPAVQQAALKKRK
ncbi:hypothetical protein AGABI2DRAFT_191222, partial [Agaricus bisporus var. bisporus H97]|uniref:hypothetical protein n=1 Tax=Agaricus bisporus var. bisporus (strain H97 / ATCC MYA-4626 / FGSC 10389) TaxID=936046 RepID=UPI00029F7EBB